MDSNDGLNRIKGVEFKIDKILEHIANIDVTAARQEILLAEHIRRTALNEKAIGWLYKIIFTLAMGAIGSLILFILGHVVMK